jgi:hypothetical protein
MSQENTRMEIPILNMMYIFEIYRIIFIHLSFFFFNHTSDYLNVKIFGTDLVLFLINSKAYKI